MKLTVQGGTVLDNMSDSALKVMNFGIDETDVGMVISILTDKTYSQKQLAVVREYCCNAWDAHIEAGNIDQPFEVQVPNIMDPYFRVRDFGRGLSPEMVERLYVRFAKSSKRGSDTTIGAYGIGCKSAFCYSDSFLVTSWHNGTCSKYVAQITEEKQARMIMLSSEASDEPSGIEVRVAVKHEDIKIFKQHILSICARFPTRPNVLGATEQEFPCHKVLVSGTGWYITGEKFADIGYYGSNQSVTAMCGHVAYELNLSAITGLNLDGFPRIHNVHFEFALGEVDIPPSRENLELTSKTIAAVKKKIAIFKEEIAANLSKEIEAAPDVIAALNKVPSFMHAKRFTYKGFNLGDIQDVDTSKCGATVYVIKAGALSRTLRLTDYSVSSGRTAIMINNGGKRIAARVKKIPRGDLLKIFVVFDVEKAKKLLALDYWPKDKVFYSMDLTPDPINRGEVGEKSCFDYFAIGIKEKYGRRPWQSDYKTFYVEGLEEEELPTGTKPYLIISRGKVSDENPAALSASACEALKARPGNFSIFGVRARDVEELDDTWVPLMDYVKGKIKEAADSFTEEEISIIAQGERAMWGLYSVDHKDVAEINALFKKHGTVFRKYEAKKGILEIGRNLGMPECGKIACGGTANEIDALREIFYATYPMLKYLPNRLDEADLPVVISYIKLVENNKES